MCCFRFRICGLSHIPAVRECIVLCAGRIKRHFKEKQKSDQNGVLKTAFFLAVNNAMYVKYNQLESKFK